MKRSRPFAFLRSRRGVIDKVISMVLVMVIAVALGIFLFISVFKDAANDQDRLRQGYEEEYGRLLVDSVLLSHENVSGRTYEALLTQAIGEINTTVLVHGVSVDVEAVFSDSFDALLGKDNYYFQVDPVVKGISISYVIDGSLTLADARASIEDRLPSLMESLRDETLFGEDAVIFSHVYILSGADTGGGDLCSSFTLSEGMTCDDLGGEEMYDYLMQHGYKPPAPAPYTRYAEWMSSSTDTNANHLSESDWASGSSYASFMYQDNAEERRLTSKHVIVVVADELSSNSKADVCHSIESDADIFICYTCNNTCPYARSERLVNQTLEVLQEHGDLFFGFTSFSCSYEYDTSSNSLSLTAYNCNYVDNNPNCAYFTPRRTTPIRGSPIISPNIAANLNWCEQEKCGACQRPSPLPVPWDGKYCYHSACHPAIAGNLSMLSGATGGISSELSDLSLLTDSVYEYFESQKQSFDFSIGVKNETRDRYVIQRPYTLSNGKTIDLSFWIYD